MEIKKGDYFCVTAPADGNIFAKFLAYGIKLFSAIGAKDDRAKYSHAGIITSADGDTFEALTTYKRGHLKNYKGSPIIIGRHIDATEDKVGPATEKVMFEYEGRIYPFIRLGAFMLPLVSKFMHTKPVCSELCFLHMVHARHRANTHDNTYIDYYWGLTPDYLADAIINWDVLEVVYEGILGEV